LSEAAVDDFILSSATFPGGERIATAAFERLEDGTEIMKWEVEKMVGR